MWFRRIALTLVVVGLLCGAAEMFARFELGLGDPPLSVSHEKIEYLLKPNQDVRCFGNRVIVNAYGMRTEDFPKQKPVGEFRVMVFGDSVVNGGALTDHSKIATTLLGKRLFGLGGRPVVIGNISAGSWGPGNWLAYAKEYGFFGADVVILVISSHDYADNPTFAPLDSQTHPQERPWSAVWEGVIRYLPRYSLSGRPKVPLPTIAEVKPTVAQGEIERGLADLREFLNLAVSSGAHVLVAQYPESQEVVKGYAEGYRYIKGVAEEVGVDAFPLDFGIRAALNRGASPYRDNIHPNDIGQAILASALFDALSEHGFLAQ